jgi:hypothetical protein
MPLRGSWKSSLVAATLAGASFLMVFVLGEAAFRAKNAFFERPLGEVVVRDAILGWRARPDYRFAGEKRDAAGKAHPVEISTDHQGFRAFAAPSAGPPRVFFLGDSFTFAKDVSQPETYYAVLGNRLDLAVFAYGCDGFNSLQEYLVLDAWFDRIKPDVVVWQFCYNDFIGNSAYLTRRSAKNQCQVEQPFLAPDGAVVYRNPGDGFWCDWTKRAPSALLHSLAYRFDNRHGLPALENTIETVIEKEGALFGPFQEAVKTTGEIMDKVRARCGAIPILAFNVDTRAPYHAAFRSLCAAHGIRFLEKVPEAIQEASNNGAIVFAEDGGHWSALGHKVCAEILAPEVAGACTPPKAESVSRP